jgi:hypothetical protein
MRLGSWKKFLNWIRVLRESLFAKFYSLSRRKTYGPPKTRCKRSKPSRLADSSRARKNPRVWGGEQLEPRHMMTAVSYYDSSSHALHIENFDGSDGAAQIAADHNYNAVSVNGGLIIDLSKMGDPYVAPADVHRIIYQSNTPNGYVDLSAVDAAFAQLNEIDVSNTASINWGNIGGNAVDIGSHESYAGYGGSYEMYSFTPSPPSIDPVLQPVNPNQTGVTFDGSTINVDYSQAGNTPTISFIVGVVNPDSSPLFDFNATLTSGDRTNLIPSVSIIDSTHAQISVTLDSVSDHSSILLHIQAGYGESIIAEGDVTINPTGSAIVANGFSLTTDSSFAAHDNLYDHVLDAFGNRWSAISGTAINGEAAYIDAQVFATDHGQVTLYSDGSFDYVSSQGYVGDDSFTFAARSTDGEWSNVSTVYISLPTDPSQLSDGTQTLTAPDGSQWTVTSQSGTISQLSDINRVQFSLDTNNHLAVETSGSGTISIDAVSGINAGTYLSGQSQMTIVNCDLGNMNVSTGQNCTFNADQHLAGLSIGDCTTTISGNHTVIADSLYVAEWATLDIGNGAVAVNYSDSNPFEQLTANVASAENIQNDGPTWTGAGITSSVAANDPYNMTVGIGDNSTIGRQSLRGQPINGNAILIVATYAGNGNLGNNHPIAYSSTSVNVDQGSSPVAIYLSDYFSDPMFNRETLSFSVYSNDNTTLVSANIDTTGNLELTFTPGEVGTAQVIICATNPDGVTTIADPIMVTVTPVIVSSDFSVTADSSFSFTGNLFDHVTAVINLKRNSTPLWKGR